MKESQENPTTNIKQNSSSSLSWLIPLAFFFGYKMVQLVRGDAIAENICKPVPAYQKSDCLSCVKQGKIFNYDPSNRLSNTSCTYKKD